MNHFMGSNLPVVKRQNRSAVLKALLRHGPLSRGQLGQMTLLTPSTVTNIVSELMAQNLVREIEPRQVRERKPIGRRPARLEINPRGGCVIGVYVGAKQFALSLGDLGARVLASARTQLPAEMSSQCFVDTLTAGIKGFLAAYDGSPGPVFGVGAVVAGSVDPERGTLVELPHHSWRDVPIVAALQDQLPFPVAIENSRRAMALAEVTFGGASRAASVVLVHVATTIGCGIVIDHRLYPGDHLRAGELSHVVVDPDGDLCPCGNRGCLELMASDAGIIRIARAELVHAPESLLWEFCDADLDRLNANMVLDAARRGDAAARQVITQVAAALGHAIANLVLTIDPSTVIVAGRLVDAGDVLFEPLREVIDTIVGRVTGRTVEIRPSAFGAQAPLVAGLAVALQQFVYSPLLTLPTDLNDNTTIQRLNRVYLEV